jgi:hypothetical protein
MSGSHPAPRPRKRSSTCPPPRRSHQFLLCAPLSGSTARASVTHITIANTPTADGTPVNTAQIRAALNAVEARNAAGDTVLTLGDFNAQPNYGRIANWYALYRELDDTDTRCAGYGEWTATGTSGAPPACSGGTTTCTTTVTAGCSKIDLAFVRKDRLAGAYSADALAIPTTGTGVAATSDYPAGSCSDHRVVVGTVPVRFG